MSIPHQAMKLSVNGRLEDLSDWNSESAEQLAAADGLTLTPAHWEIIHLMREYYERYNISPIKKLLKKEMAARLPEGESKATDAYLDALFPYGVLVQGTKIAGLPIPMLDAEIEQMHAVTMKPGAPEEVPEIAFEGRTYRLTASGNLANPSDWDERLAGFLAEQDGIRLTPEHWEVIRYLRDFYFKYGIAPMVRLLMEHMSRELGDQKGSHEYLYRLFPRGPSRQGSRIAGLPEPQGCID
ncbi:MAG: TusE/DsrC/DsvC family sulfur relay protein [Betaproteobacteria bacterium]|nr:TusE/DsrC/DsvC family sulfur relay protein [Betaproteobacteria bacterium]